MHMEFGNDISMFKSWFCHVHVVILAKLVNMLKPQLIYKLKIVVGEVEEDIEGINGNGWRLALGGGRTVQCTDDVLQNSAPETCIILLTSVTPINSIKKKKIKTMVVEGH